MKKENGNFKLISGFIAGIIVASATVVGANQAIQAIQNTEIKVSLNGQVQTFKDETTNETQYPITYHDRTYLPLRNVAQLAGLNVDYDSSTNTAILNDTSKIYSTGESGWKAAYYSIIGSVSDEWSYGEETEFGFVYLNDDDIPELVFGSEHTSLLIYSYDDKKDCAYLLANATTGARGATSITYIEKENIIIEQSAGMLFESEYQDKEGCVGAHYSWGEMIKLDTGWYESWSKDIYVFDENDDSKDVVEINMSEEVEEYLKREKQFNLSYTKEEARNVVFGLKGTD